ncbi:uncharacterized protein [Eleutherodactylus coqui]|uniref:uncharacterized protein n=1 Tax=Eleutherodactylus coqui TaxID=57060 RepID=UPI0034631C22
MEEMLRRIRAEAEERDLTWLVRLIDGPAGEAAPAPAAAPMFPMPEESGRRPRRARVPVRLSPEQAPARRRRVRSPSPAPPRDVPPATPTGRGRRPGGAAARRNIRAAPDVREQERATEQQTAAASERRQGAGGGAPGHVPVGAPTRRSNRPDNGGSRQRPIRQQQAEDGGSRQRPSITEAAKRASAPRKAAGTRTERFQPGGELPAARIDDPEDDESQQQDVGAAAGGYTAPSQPVGAVPDAGAGSGADGEAVPSTALERGKRAVGDLISQSLARGTRAAYSAAWTEWEDWMDQCGGAYSTDDRVGMLLSWLGRGSREGWTLGRVNRFMAGVAFGCKLKGVVDVTKNFIVRQALKGFRRGKGRPDTRRPVSFGILERLGGAIDSVCGENFERLLFKAVFSLAFFGAFRVGELVSPSKAVGGGVQREDVRLVKDRLEIFVRRSKTDQEGRGQLVRLGKVAGAVMCPIRAFNNYRSWWEIPEEEKRKSQRRQRRGGRKHKRTRKGSRKNDDQIRRQTTDARGENAETDLVVNISSRTLSKIETAVLSKGLSFCPVNNVDWFQVDLD